LMSQIAHCVISGKTEEVKSLVQEALSEGARPEEALDQGLLPGMEHVSVQFREGEMFIPEVLLSARAMHAGMEILKPLLVEAGAGVIGNIILGTVKGDLHDIGKNLVRIMMQSAGLEVIDLGIDVAPERFVEAVKETGAQIVGMSALLTTTMQMMPVTITTLKEAGLRDQIKVMVGGAPVTQDFADKIGADGYASNAAGAADLARQWITSQA